MENLKKWENLFATKGSELEEVLKNKSADPADLLKEVQESNLQQEIEEVIPANNITRVWA